MKVKLSFQKQEITGKMKTKRGSAEKPLTDATYINEGEEEAQMRRIAYCLAVLLLAFALTGCEITPGPGPGLTTGIEGYIYVRASVSPAAAENSEDQGDVLFSASEVPPYGYVALRNAVVQARNDYSGQTESGRTGNNGYFRITGLASGPYTVRVLSLRNAATSPYVYANQMSWVVGNFEGMAYYLVIGISSYSGDRYYPGPAQDAEAIYNTLHGGNMLAGYGKLLKNSQATKANIKREIDNLISMARSPHDYLVIYFSGLSGSDYLSPYDDNGQTWSTAITDAELESWVKFFPGDSVTLIVDGSFSETMADGKPFQPFAFRKDWRYTVLAGARKNQRVNYDNKLGHSVFTHFLLMGLQTRNADLNRDGNITAYELYEYTKEEMYWYYDRNRASDYHEPYIYEGYYGDTPIFRY